MKSLQIKSFMMLWPKQNPASCSRPVLRLLSALDELIKWCPCNYFSTVLLKKFVAKSLII
jgi:hypothetical protein